MAMFNSKLLVPGPSASEAGAARAVWTASIEHTLARPGGSVAALGPWAPGPKPGVETMGLIWLNQENWGVKQHIYIYIHMVYSGDIMGIYVDIMKIIILFYVAIILQHPPTPFFSPKDPAARSRVTRSIGLKMWLKTSVIHSCHRSWRGTNSFHGRNKTHGAW